MLPLFTFLFPSVILRACDSLPHLLPFLKTIPSPFCHPERAPEQVFPESRSIARSEGPMYLSPPECGLCPRCPSGYCDVASAKLQCLQFHPSFRFVLDFIRSITIIAMTPLRRKRSSCSLTIE